MKPSGSVFAKERRASALEKVSPAEPKRMARCSWDKLAPQPAILLALQSLARLGRPCLVADRANFDLIVNAALAPRSSRLTAFAVYLPSRSAFSRFTSGPFVARLARAYAARRAGCAHRRCPPAAGLTVRFAAGLAAASAGFGASAASPFRTGVGWRRQRCLDRGRRRLRGLGRRQRRRRRRRDAAPAPRAAAAGAPAGCCRPTSSRRAGRP